jgi:hypothetical protein
MLRRNKTRRMAGRRASTVTGAIAAACFALWLLLPGGCSQVEMAYLANGTRVARISCGLAMDSFARCYKTAGDMCGRRGYVLFDWDGKPWPLPYPDPAALDNDTALTSTALLVACRS